MIIRYPETLQNCATLTELLLSKENQETKGIGFIAKNGEEKFLSYADLLRNAKKVLGFLQASGLQKGDTVLFLLTDNCDLIHTYWACVLGGMIPAPIPADPDGENKDRFFKVLSIMKETSVVYDPRSETLVREAIESGLFTEEKAVSSEDLYSCAVDGVLCDAAPKDAVLIQYSSSSAGDQKGVVLSHGNMMSSLDMMINRSLSNSRDVLIAWMPLTHDMGLIGGHLKYAAVDAMVYMMQPSTFLQNPKMLLQKVTEHRATVLILTNHALKTLMDSAQGDNRAKLDLSSLRLIFNGEEDASAEVCTKFLNAFERFGLKRNTMYPVYGMAEATLSITFPQLCEPIFNRVIVDQRYMNIRDRIRYLSSKSEDFAIGYVDRGYPLRNCKIRVCDENGNDLGEDRVGVIEVRGGCVFEKYYDNGPTHIVDGWYRTPDYGFFHEGRLIIVGRAKGSATMKGENDSAAGLPGCVYHGACTGALYSG